MSRQRGGRLLLRGEEAEEEGSEPLEPPLSRAWCVLPLLCGLPLQLLAASSYLQELVLRQSRCFNFGMSLCLHVAGTALMTQALAIYFIAVTAESEELDSILAQVQRHNGAAAEQFLRSMEGLLALSCFKALLWGAFTAAAAYVYFDDAAYAAGLFGLVGAGTAVTSNSQVGFLNAVTALCQEEITIFIEQQLGKGGVDWHRMAREHRALDLRFEEIFAGGRLGIVLFSLVLRELLLCCVLSVMGNCVDGVYSRVMVWAMAVLLALRAVYVLKGIAELTDRCSDTSPRQVGWAIKASVNKASSLSEMTEGQDVAHVRFVEYLANTELGIQVFGVSVTMQVICSLLSLTISAIPMVVGFSWPLLEPKNAMAVTTTTPATGSYAAWN